MAVREQRWQTAGKKRRQPSRRRAGKEGEEGRMRDERRRREGRQQQGRELGLGGSDSGGAGHGGQSWETHLEMIDFACVRGQRGRQKMWGHHEWVGSTVNWELVGGFGWREAEQQLEQDLQQGYLDR